MSTGFFMPLFAADIDELLGGIIPIVFFVIWIVSQILNRKSNEFGAPRQPPARRPMAGADDALAGPPAEAQDEIERFLREVASRRQGQAPMQPEVVRPAAPVVGQPRPRPQRRPKPKRVVTPVEPRRAMPEQPDAPLAPVGSGVPEHVRDYISKPFPTHITSAEGITTLQPTVAGHVAHHMGTPGATATTGTAGVVPTAPLDLASLLASGHGLQQAIVLTEILGPPRAHRRR
jgi:hypothetical protein